MENNLNGKYWKQKHIAEIDEVTTVEIHEYAVWHDKNRYLLLSKYGFLVLNGPTNQLNKIQELIIIY